VTVTLVNANDPLCNDVRGPFSLNPTLCDLAASMEGVQYFSFTYTGDNQLVIMTDLYGPPEGPGAGHVTIIRKGEGGDTWTIPTGETLSLEGEGYEGDYCVFSSDEEGEPLAGAWGSLLLMGLGSTIGSKNIEKLELSRVLIADNGGGATPALFINDTLFTVDPDLRHMTQLVSYSFGNCIFPTFPNTTGMDMQYIDLPGCSLEAAPSLVGYPNLISFAASDNNLPDTEVDRIFNEISAGTTAGGGSISTIGQTPPAPPTSASDAARTELSSRSPAWLLGFD
jgi:hypothetical protein